MKIAKYLIGSAILVAFMALAYTMGRAHGYSQKMGEDVVAWQSAYAHLADKAGHCVDPKEINEILQQNVTSWPDFTTPEADVVFADWRKEVRGHLLARYLRNAGIEVTDDEYTD